MIHTKTQHLNTIQSAIALVRDSFKHHYAGFSTWAIFLVLITLAILAGLKLSTQTQLFMAGEIALNDVIADRALKVEDTQATQLRREQSMALQPMLFDLNKAAVVSFRENILNLLTEINTHSLDIESLTRIQEAFNDRFSTNFDRQFFIVLANEEVQAKLTDDFLPFSEKLLLQGVFTDLKQLATSSQSSILIRDIESGSETLLSQNSSSLQDLRSFYLRLGQELKNVNLPSKEKSVLLTLIEVLASPTLMLNREATMQRAATVSAALAPIFYLIQKGELIVSQGELVTREQQLKMQALYKYTAKKIDILQSFGFFILISVLSLGLFITPTGNLGTALHAQDQYFIAILILFFSLMAFTLGQFLSFTLHVTSLNAWAFSLPIAGAAGLSALIFSARRYCVIGLLLSVFASVFLKGGLPLFLFFYLSAMFNTFLILRAQNRHDVVTSTVLLFVWQILTGLGAALFSIIELEAIPTLLLALSFNTVLSLFVIFAFSPLVEMFLGLSTRFSLMELMNLEQPLLQELMMTTPGTYHHSLIVSNLVEAAAKAVGANSLLCKVGALYHDIGKLVRPEYFIENQYGGFNKHDLLAPAMSALIITSHVKQGVELAEQYHLGKEIIDIISQHHGNRCITFFYNKAQKNNENPSEADYSYPNQRPQTREAAIVMVADAVEASSRTLNEPTPARIRSHVDIIIKGIYSEGQLDESELTFKDLNKISEAFTRILTGLFHQRIVYPEKKPSNQS